MDFGELLRQKKDAIAARWFDSGLSIYPDFAADKFHRQKDRFANPVGHSLREGTAAIVAALLAGDDDEVVGSHLTEIIKIRAVQQFPPSTALRFVFELKAAVRSELGDIRLPGVAGGLSALEARVDRLALTAFDIFVACREQVYGLRVNEAKRRVAWVVDRLNGRCGDLEDDADPVLAEIAAAGESEESP